MRKMTAKICIQEDEASFGLQLMEYPWYGPENWKKKHHNNKFPLEAWMKLPTTAMTTSATPWPESFQPNNWPSGEPHTNDTHLIPSWGTEDYLGYSSIKLCQKPSIHQVSTTFNLGDPWYFQRNLQKQPDGETSISFLFPHSPKPRTYLILFPLASHIQLGVKVLNLQ